MSPDFSQKTNHRSEGVDATCHYLICGVQGDFTQGLVDSPPRTVWTRELKVSSRTIVTCQNLTTYCSLRACPTHQSFTNEGFGSAQGQASALHSQLVFRRVHSTLTNTPALQDADIAHRIPTGELRAVAFGLISDRLALIPQRYLLWMGSDQEKTFGPTICGLVEKLGPDRVTLWDSKQRGWTFFCCLASG